MKIWLIIQNNTPPELGHYNRHYNFAKYLHQMGHEPTVIVSSFLHNQEVQLINNEARFLKYDEVEFPFYFVKVNDYSNRKEEVVSFFQYYRNVMKFTKRLDKPDVILGSSSQPLAALAAINLAKRYKCESIVEVRDLWPASFVAYDIVQESNPLMKLFYAGEKWLYKKADKIIFTMEGGLDYIREKGWSSDKGGPVNQDKVFHINNGVDLDVFNLNKSQYVFEDSDLDDKNSFKVVYTGSIRKANNVQGIIDAAKEVSNISKKNIKFLIFGDGNQKEELEIYCKENSINNVVFKGHIEKKYIASALSKSDLNLIHFPDNKLKKYGVSLNKMFDYFASGKPVISDSRFGYDLVERFNAGIVVDNASSNNFAEAIVKVSEMSNVEYEELCKNSLTAAKDYDFKNLTKKLIDVIEKEVL